MNGKRYRDALPFCICGCGRRVGSFKAKYLPGHHTKELKGERNSFFGKTHTEFARVAIAKGKKRNNEYRK